MAPRFLPCRATPIPAYALWLATIIAAGTGGMELLLFASDLARGFNGVEAQSAGLLSEAGIGGLAVAIALLAGTAALSLRGQADTTSEVASGRPPASDSHHLRAQNMQALGQLTAGAAHDLNNLLAIVIGNLELLDKRLTHDPATHDPATHEPTAAALGAARRGSALVQRLLGVARGQPMPPKPVDLRGLLDGMSDLLRHSVGDGIRVELRCPADLPPVWTDPAELEIALLNLVLNARDAMPAGGAVTVEAARVCREEAAAHGDAVRGTDRSIVVSVSDTGAGMTPEVRARAFEPFFTTKPAGEGSGLGLSMVRALARRSGGEARITSAPGKGTRVELALPAARDGGKDRVAARNAST